MVFIVLIHVMKSGDSELLATTEATQILHLVTRMRLRLETIRRCGALLETVDRPICWGRHSMTLTRSFFHFDRESSTENLHGSEIETPCSGMPTFRVEASLPSERQSRSLRRFAH
ncbi:hypothetical protein MPTK2_8g13290 [Marchantia polymorpha subsp. ruderalis]